MELLLSSPVPLAAAGVLLPIIVGVFFYELRNQRKQHEAPKTNFVPPVVTISQQPAPSEAPKPAPTAPPPQSSPPPVPPAKLPPQAVPAAAPAATSSQPVKKKGGNKIVYGIVGLLVLGGGVGVTVYLAGLPQHVFNFAKTPETAVTPFLTPFPTASTPLSQTGITPAVTSSLLSSGAKSLLAAAGVTRVPTFPQTAPSPSVTPIRLSQLPQTGAGVVTPTPGSFAKPTVKQTLKPTTTGVPSTGPVVPQIPTSGSALPTVIIAFGGLILLAISVGLAL